MIENNNHSSHDREELEQHADRVRSRLASTLETLDRRRRDLVHELDPKAIVRKNMPRLIAVGAASLLTLVGGVIYSVVRARQRSSHLYRERWHALGRAWRHPDRLVREEHPSFAKDIGRRIIGALVGVAMTAISRRVAASHQLSEGPRVHAR